MRILITGATGNVGAEIIRLLEQMDNIEILAAVRNPEKIKLSKKNITPVKFDFKDPYTFNILKGVDKMFLMRPPQISNIRKFIQPAIEAAELAGVKHIVFLSLLGVEHNKVTPHYKIEQLLMRSQMSYTFLRAGFFMQNLSTTHLHDIVEENRIYLPAGKGVTSFTDVRDIAAVGAKTLTESGHENKAYNLTGKEAITYYEVASLLSGALERKITYQPATIIGFYIHMRKLGNKPVYIIIVTLLYLITRFGKAGNIAYDMKQVLGHDPITFKQFAFDYKNVFQKNNKKQEQI